METTIKKIFFVCIALTVAFAAFILGNLFGAGSLGNGIYYISAERNKNLSAADALDKLDINTADYQELLELPGMTEDVAAAIVMNRQSRGVYEEVEDLLMVRGMTLEIYEKIYQQITVR